MEFWDLTPREVVMTVEAAHERDLFLAWHIAALQRQAKLMPLAQLLAKLKPRQEIPIEQRRAEFEELKARMMPQRNNDGR